MQRADSPHSTSPFSTWGGHFGLTDMGCILGKIETCFKKPSACLTTGFAWLRSFCKTRTELLLLKLWGKKGDSCIAALGKKEAIAFACHGLNSLSRNLQKAWPPRGPCGPFPLPSAARCLAAAQTETPRARGRRAGTAGLRVASISAAPPKQRCGDSCSASLCLSPGAAHPKAQTCQSPSPVRTMAPRAKARPR